MSSVWNIGTTQKKNDNSFKTRGEGETLVKSWYNLNTAEQTLKKEAIIVKLVFKVRR